MLGIRFTDEFNHDAVAQVVDRGHSVAKVSERLEISTKWLYTWRTQFSQLRKRIIETTELAIEIRRLKTELACVSEERDILTNAPPRTSPGMQDEVRVRGRASSSVFGTQDVSLPQHPS